MEFSRYWISRSLKFRSAVRSQPPIPQVLECSVEKSTLIIYDTYNVIIVGTFIIEGAETSM